MPDQPQSGAEAPTPNSVPMATPVQGPVWPMSLHPEGPGHALTPAPPHRGWKFPPSPWDEPMPGIDHKRAAFKPSQRSPWPTATVFGSNAAGIGAAGIGGAGIGGAGQAGTAEHRVQPNVAVDASGRVIAELICLRCGYALRGLDVASKCPECGVDVAESLKSDQLIHADAVWLDRVASGLRWAWILALVGWLGTLAGIVLGSTGIVSRGSTGLLTAFIGRPIIAAKLVVWWRWTMPERTAEGQTGMGFSGKREGLSARKATRLFAMVSLGVVFAQTIGPLMGVRGLPALPSGLGPIASVSLNGARLVLWIAHYAAVTACFFATCIYLKQLARRANDSALLGYCQVTMIVAPVLAIVLGCLIIGLVFAWFMWWAMLISAESTVSSIARTRKAAARLAEYSGAVG